MKIKVVTWFDDGYLLGKKFQPTNIQRCEEFGYKYIHSQERQCEFLSPHWERIPLIQKNLDETDYIIWLDGDAYLTGKPIPEIKADLTVSLDVDRVNNTNWRVNSGAFILKNCDWAIEFLSVWLNLGPQGSKDYALHEKMHHKHRVRFHDQGALRYMILKNLCSIKNHIDIKEYGVLQNFRNESAFVAHKAGIYREKYE